MGKTYSALNIIKPYFEQYLGYYVSYLDCNSISSLIQNQEQIDIALDYIRLKYQSLKEAKPALLILDNLHSICPMISNDEQLNIVDQVKS